MFNKIIAMLIIIILIPVFLIIGATIYLADGFPILYWSKRIGTNNKEFFMPKFRTMKNNSPIIATHELLNPEKYLIKFGSFLRKTSLDELPQFYSIIRGDLIIIGPRPALFNQKDLIELRTKYGINKMKFGITGWAQVKGRDDLSIEEKVSLEKYYKNHKSSILDIQIFFMTLRQIIISKGISH